MKNAATLEFSPAGTLNLWEMRWNRLKFICQDDDVAVIYLDEDEMAQLLKA